MVGETRLTTDQLLELLPQQRPFRFVDRIVEVDDGHIVGEYTFRDSEFFYAGHFPGHPLTPGVILLEAMCQVGVVALGLYIASKETPLTEVQKYHTVFTDTEAEFLKPVFPGERVVIKGELIFMRRRKIRAKVQMYNAAGERVAEALASGIGVEHA